MCQKVSCQSLRLLLHTSCFYHAVHFLYFLTSLLKTWVDPASFFGSGVSTLPLFGGPLKSPLLQASSMPLHLVIQMSQAEIPVGRAVL